MTDNTINKEGTSSSIGDQQSTERSKKEPWQWAVDAAVWAACVVALCLILLVPSENIRFVKIIREGLEKSTNGTDYIIDSTDYVSEVD